MEVNALVLLTGISGFLGRHTALALLKAGYQVRGTLRDLDRAVDLRVALEAEGADTDSFEFVALDLTEDAGWNEGLAGCVGLVHTASPFVLTMPRDPQVLIRPAVEGTRRAVRAALEGGVERIVLTSSLAAIDSGHASYGRPFDGSDWTDPDGPNVNAYIRSKTLAEGAAWLMMREAGRDKDLTVINPGTLQGPPIGGHAGPSGEMVRNLLTGAMPAVPDIILPFVDVRDVAQAHVTALKDDASRGRRIPMVQSVLSLREVARLLRKRAPAIATQVPRRSLPTWAARTLALVDPGLAGARPYLGVRRSYDSTAGAALLGGPYRPAEDAILDMAWKMNKGG